jgi:hypothetical protein
MSWRRLGFLAALVAAFTAGSSAGVRFAKRHYVSRDRIFIEGEIIQDEK